MLTQFPMNKPSFVSHARALTLKAMGDEVLDEMASDIAAIDNNPEYDLNADDNLVVVSAANGESSADFSARLNPETKEVSSLNVMPAPGNEDIPFQSFSYHSKDDQNHYRFEINGKVERVIHDVKTDIISTDL
jgi:hypothetical protein